MTATPAFISDAYFAIGGTDLSDHVRDIQVIENTITSADATVMGDTGARRKNSNVLDWEVRGTFDMDYSASSVYAKLSAMLSTPATVAVRKSKTDAISATNPEFQGTGQPSEVQHVNASSVGGDVHRVPFTIKCSNGVALIHDTTP
jgi:hypothetical protein